MSGFDFNCDAVTGWPPTLFRAILILSDIFLCSIINCAKKKDTQDYLQTYHCNVAVVTVHRPPDLPSVHTTGIPMLNLTRSS